MKAKNCDMGIIMAKFCIFGVSRGPQTTLRALGNDPEQLLKNRFFDHVWSVFGLHEPISPHLVLAIACDMGILWAKFCIFRVPRGPQTTLRALGNDPEQLFKNRFFDHFWLFFGPF